MNDQHDQDRTADDGCPHDPEALSPRAELAVPAMEELKQAIMRATENYERATGLQAPSVSLHWGEYPAWKAPNDAELARRANLRVRFGTAAG